MKIAILTEILSTHSGSRAPIELAKYLSVKDKITLLAYALRTDKKVKKELENLGIKIVLIDPLKLPFGKWLAAFKFLPFLKNHGLISFHGTLPTFLVAKLSGLPIIQTYYGTQLDAYLEKLLPFQKPSLKDKFFNLFGNQLIFLIQKVYFRLSTQVVAISQYTSLEAQKLFGRKVPFIHLGATPLPSHTPYPIRQTPYPTILSVSRITPYKGFHLLIEAVKKTKKKVNLFIVGSAPQLKYLAYLKKIANENTKIITDIADENLARLYQNCDIYASCDRYLFFGLPPLEAALFGKPSVILNYCAAPEIVVHNKTGFVARDIKEFTGYLHLLIEDVKLRNQLGKQAKKWVEDNFRWRKTAYQYRRLFGKVSQ